MWRIPTHTDRRRDIQANRMAHDSEASVKVIDGETKKVKQCRLERKRGEQMRSVVLKEEERHTRIFPFNM